MANDPKNIKPRILVKTLANFESVGIDSTLLDKMTSNPKFNAGVKRNNYYILRTDAIIRTRELTRAFAFYLHIMRAAMTRGFTMIQVIIPKNAKHNS